MILKLASFVGFLTFPIRQSCLVLGLVDIGVNDILMVLSSSVPHTRGHVINSTKRSTVLVYAAPFLVKE